MDNQSVGGVNPDGFAIASETRHKIGPASNDRRPTGKLVTGLKHRVFGECFKIVIAIDESAQALHDNFEVGIKGFKNFVLVFLLRHLFHAPGEFILSEHSY